MMPKSFFDAAVVTTATLARTIALLLVTLGALSHNVLGLATPPVSSSHQTPTTSRQLSPQSSRREALECLVSVAVATTMGLALPPVQPSVAAEMDVDSYLKVGGVSMPMGVSGQGGKMRPETGVNFRDGSDVSRDPRTGDVLAEILLKSSDEQQVLVLTTFSSPWPLASGPTYDVECRDGSTGDGVYLAVSSKVDGKSIDELPNKFFQDQLFSPTGRFSFYGAPTDVKIKKTPSSGNLPNYKVLDIDFSILSQSTGAEVPRKARVAATIPEGTTQAVMLVASASAVRWKKGSDSKIATTIDSFRATPAPATSLKIRAKESF